MCRSGGLHRPPSQQPSETPPSIRRYDKTDDPSPPLDRTRPPWSKPPPSSSPSSRHYYTLYARALNASLAPSLRHPHTYCRTCMNLLSHRSKVSRPSLVDACCPDHATPCAIGRYGYCRTCELSFTFPLRAARRGRPSFFFSAARECRRKKKSSQSALARSAVPDGRGGHTARRTRRARSAARSARRAAAPRPPQWAPKGRSAALTRPPSTMP